MSLHTRKRIRNKKRLEKSQEILLEFYDKLIQQVHEMKEIFLEIEKAYPNFDTLTEEEKLMLVAEYKEKRKRRK